MDIKELRDFLNSERTEYLNLSDEYLESHSVDKADYKFISYKPADTIYLQSIFRLLYAQNYPKFDENDTLFMTDLFKQYLIELNKH